MGCVYFPRMLIGCTVYVSLLGFSEDRFPLSSVEEFNYGIRKSHDATVRVFILCVKRPSGGGSGGGEGA